MNQYLLEQFLVGDIFPWDSIFPIFAVKLNLLFCVHYVSFMKANVVWYIFHCFFKKKNKKFFECKTALYFGMKCMNECTSGLLSVQV